MKKIVTLMPNPYRDRGFQITRAARKILMQHGAEVRVCIPFHAERSAAAAADLHILPLDRALDGSSLLICFGGDGTILHAAHLIDSREIPLLGVNTGTMGFMAELEHNELDMLPMALGDEIDLEPRMMIRVRVKRRGREIFSEDALNDAVVIKGSVARIMHMTIQSDEAEAMRFDGDGVILSTPTGTTAYTLSAGGPIVEPTAENIIVTPICAHAMATHPLVLRKDRLVRVLLSRTGRQAANLTVDGGKAFHLDQDDIVEISSSDRFIRLVKLKKISYYRTLMHKMQG